MLKKKWNFETLFSISDGTVFEINKETVEVFFDKETVSVDPNDNYQKKDYLDRSKSLLFHELVVIHNLRIANKCWLNKKR